MIDSAPASNPLKKLVLIVDDDESLLDLIDHVVRKEGFRTERANDGVEALKKALALSPDLILLDFLLPGMSGHDIIKALRDGGRGGIPIIAITGQQLSPAAVDAVRKEPSVREFLQKPIRTAELTRLILRILE
ncbi:MAG: response regulator [Elusimicrobiota bacterium]